MIRYTFITLLLVAFTACSTDDGPNGGGDPIPDGTIRSQLFMTSNSTGNVVEYQFRTGNQLFTNNYESQSSDAEGLIYLEEQDALIQASRSGQSLNYYANVSASTDGSGLNLAFSSTNVLESPRDVTMNGDFFVVSDDTDLDGDSSTEEGRFFIFELSDDAFSLRNTVTVNFAVWGIQFVGNDLYAVVDKTNRLARFDNFIDSNTADAEIVADKTIGIEGITRTHGIAYDGTSMVLTDIGNASSGNDGALRIINSFLSKFNGVADGEELSFVGNQIDVSGTFTKLGNPVDVAYDSETRTVFVAEKANDDGKILIFDAVEAGGDISPTLEANFNGISSLYYLKR